MVTSKGAAAVTGSGFVTLAATLAAFPAIPVAGPDAAARRRSLHVRGARDHEPDRQRGRDDGRSPDGTAPSTWIAPGAILDGQPAQDQPVEAVMVMYVQGP